MNDRPIPRLIAAGAIVLLGMFSLQRIRIEYLPRAISPVAFLSLTLPESTTTEDVARRWVAPIESRIRAAGEIRGIRGEVRATGAELEIHFTPHADLARKTARLLTELSGLRARLPEGGRLDVIAGTDLGNEPAAIVVISGNDAAAHAESIEEELLRIAGVRDVELYGIAGREIAVHLSTGSDALAAEVRRAIRRSIAPVKLGVAREGSREIAVSSAGDTERLDLLPIRVGVSVARLGDLARIQPRVAERPTLARFNGQPAIVAVLDPESDASPLALDRSIRNALERINDRRDAQLHLTILSSGAEALRRLLEALTIGFALALLAAFLTGWILAGLRGAATLSSALVVAVAAVMNVYWLARIELNVATWTATAIAVGSAIVFAALSRIGIGSLPPLSARWIVAITTAALLPAIAIALAGGGLSASLREPANAFAFASVAASLGTLLLPRVRGRVVPASSRLSEREGRPKAGTLRERNFIRAMRALRNSIRDPVTVLLLSLTAIVISLTLFGPSLDPRSRSLSPNSGRLVAQVTLAEGATLEQTETIVKELEQRLVKFESIERHWSWLRPESARIVIELAAHARGKREREEARRRILQALRGAGASIRLTSATGGNAQNDLWGEPVEERPSIDEEITSYRMIVKSGEVATLRGAVARLRDRLAVIGFRGFAVDEESASPSIRVDLIPSRPTPGEQRTAIAAALRARSTLPPAITLPGRQQRSVRVYTTLSPARSDVVPQREDLLNRPIAVGTGATVPSFHLRTRETLIVPAVARQGGRFVLPVTVAITDRRIEERKTKREKIDRNLAAMPIPAGVEIARPADSRRTIPVEKLRLFGIAAMLPLLLLASAIIALNSFARAVDALVPLAGGVAVAAPLLSMSDARVDELTLFAIAAVVSSVLPFALFLLHRGDDRRNLVRTTYRLFRRSALPLLGGSLIVALLLIGSTIRVDAEEDPWAASFRAAGAAGASSIASLPFLSAALLLGRAAWRRQRAAETRQLRRPPSWSSAERSTLQLAARSLTKRYPNGVFALREVSFELRPGVIGLLGPNGAGKTTLLRLLTGLLQPTRGQVLFRGVPVVAENLAEYRRHIGFLPQEFNAYPGFTAAEFLDYWGLERGIVDRKERESEIELLLTAIGLEGEENRKVRDFSGGMRQRIGIARALLGAPPVLIVDEPTTGLDIESRNRFRGLILSIAPHRVVILSTHIAGDVEATASRILLIHKGRLRFDGPPAALVERARGRVFEAIVSDDDVRHFSERFRITARVRTLEGIRVRAVAAPDEAIAGRPIEPSLEEAYLAEIDRADSTRRGWRTRSRFSFLTELQ